MNCFKQEIHQRALLAAKEFKRSESKLIQILQEVEDSRLYLDLELTSLHRYAIQTLGLSENVASDFITVARKARVVPLLQEALREGNVSVSKVRKVAPVLTFENQEVWMDKIKNLSSKQLEREVATVCPREAAPERTKYVSEDRLELRMGISQEMFEQLKRVQDLESKRTAHPATLEDTLQVLLQVYLEVKAPEKRAERVLKRRERLEETKIDKKDGAETQKLSVLRRTNRVKQSGNSSELGNLSEQNKRRAIPALVKHQIQSRDRGQCTHSDLFGKRCENRRWTEIHHIVPWAVGGGNTVENLTTLCSAHHKMNHR
jgi:5-methylcytosine-specific restriction endonuclease McrA